MPSIHRQQPLDPMTGKSTPEMGSTQTTDLQRSLAGRSVSRFAKDDDDRSRLFDMLGLTA